MIINKEFQNNLGNQGTGPVFVSHLNPFYFLMLVSKSWRALS